MSSLIMFVTYKNALVFCGSTPSTYGLNLLSLSDVLLKTFKAYQPRNPWYILLMEVPHNFTLACNQHQGIRLVPDQDLPYALIRWYVSKTIYLS